MRKKFKIKISREFIRTRPRSEPKLSRTHRDKKKYSRKAKHRNQND